MIAGDFSNVNGVKEEIDVTDFRFHLSFSFATKYNDLAVLKLASDVHPNRGNPIQFCRQSYENHELAVCGRGRLFEDIAEVSEVLQEVKAFERAGESCPTGPVTRKQICVSSDGMNRGVCNGDSGGPLYPIEDGEALCLYGLASSSKKCGYSSVYVRVQPYIEWIEKKIEKMQGDID